MDVSPTELRAFIKHMWDDCHDGGDFERTHWAKQLDILLFPERKDRLLSVLECIRDDRHTCGVGSRYVNEAIALIKLERERASEIKERA